VSGALVDVFVDGLFQAAQFPHDQRGFSLDFRVLFQDGFQLSDAMRNICGIVTTQEESGPVVTELYTTSFHTRVNWR